MRGNCCARRYVGTSERKKGVVLIMEVDLLVHHHRSTGSNRSSHRHDYRHDFTARRCWLPPVSRRSLVTGSSRSNSLNPQIIYLRTCKIVSMSDALQLAVSMMFPSFAHQSSADSDPSPLTSIVAGAALGVGADMTALTTLE
jgi:hypothetical protein